MQSISNTIRIKKDAPRCLVFEVVSSSGAPLARSAPYASFCKLEAALTRLDRGAEAAETVTIDIDGATTWVRPGAAGVVSPWKERLQPRGLHSCLRACRRRRCLTTDRPSERRPT